MLKSLFAMRPIARRTSARFAGEPPSPAQPLAVIGDVHGRIDCLNALLDQLQAEAADCRWVFVGDYVDRGDHSAEVLDRLWEVRRYLPETVFLLGNHEEMMIDFLEDPVQTGNLWLYYGGLSTMISVGFRGLKGKNDADSLIWARDHLRAHLGPEREAWLRTLPRAFESGNVAVVHAAANPARPIGEQAAELTWGHEDFPRKARRDGLWIVHGHSIVEQARQKNGVISIDTGAYSSNRLTAAVLRDGAVTFLET